MVITYCLELTRNLSEEEYQYLNLLAGPAKQKRLPGYKRRQDAQRSLCGDLLLLFMLHNQCGLNVSLNSLRCGQYGEPYFASPLFPAFNLSHAGNWVVGCVSDYGPVGIDVEMFNRNGCRQIMKYFTDEEQRYLSPESEGFVQRFYELWTLKESYLKLLKTGLATPFDAFSITFHEQAIRAVTEGQLTEHCFARYWLDDSAVCSVCSTEPDFGGPVRIETQNLVDFFHKQ